MFGQVPDEPKKWDNQLWLGNKVATVKGNWKYTGEIQVRLKENTQTLNQWLLEGAATYMPAKQWEIVPDYRLSIKSNGIEHRPGFGILRKDLFGKNENRIHQVVHQVKWQADIGDNYINNGVRYVIFYNYVLNNKFIPNAGAGLFYRWSESFTGIQLVRIGGGIGYMIDVKHSINFNYFVGMTNTGSYWIFQGIPLIQLIININRDYKYVPAKYVNF